jgi:hypothetical protein
MQKLSGPHPRNFLKSNVRNLSSSSEAGCRVGNPAYSVFRKKVKLLILRFQFCSEGKSARDKETLTH